MLLLVLVLYVVNGTSDPVVCKIENYRLKLREKEKQNKENNAALNSNSNSKSKNKAMKEIFIRVRF